MCPAPAGMSRWIRPSLILATDVPRASGDEPDEYLGRNMAFESPDGQKFEVQIHTKDSLEAAEKTHPLYEKKRADDTPQPERDRLQVEMNKIFSKVPIPPNTVWSDS